jgi:hypothetical protein
MDLVDSQRMSFALESKENAAVAAEWAFAEPIGILSPFVGPQFTAGSSYDALVATCKVLRNNGLCHLIKSPVVKQVHALFAALKEAKVAAAASGADARARLRGVLLEVAKRRLGASFTDEATLDSTWPHEYGGRLGQAMVSEGSAHRA